MKMKTMSKSFLAILLTVLMVCGSIVCMPVSAVTLNEEEGPEDFLWELDFSKMENVYDNLGNADYTLSDKGTDVTFSEIDGQKVMGVTNTNTAYFIDDTRNILKEYDAYYVEADMYFDAFPTGGDDKQNPRNYAMSFMTWITGTGTGSDSFGSIRVDDEGYLCTATGEGKRMSSTAKLPLQQWFNIRFILSPSTRQCEVFINGASVGSYGFNMKALDSITKSQIRFFDTRYSYSVYFKNISVTSDSGYRVGTTKEDTADYIGYQTTKPEGGKFDLRAIAGVSSTAFNCVGCTVYELNRVNGEVVAKSHEALSGVVYESLKQTDASGNVISVKAADLGAKYLAAIVIEDIPVPDDGSTIIIHPWAMKNGVKVYGAPKQMNLGDDTKDGYAVLSEITGASKYYLNASDDTYIGGKYMNSSDQTIHGSEEIIGMKNGVDGGVSKYDRQSYYKFTLSDEAKKILAAADSIRFEFCGGTFGFTADEKARGGVEALVSVVDNLWTEDDLTRETSEETAQILGEIGTMLYGPNSYYGIDVTEYVKDSLYMDSVAFRVENVHRDPGAERCIKSKEADDGESAPRLVIATSQMSLNYEIELSKLRNLGAEPWGYAEELVDEWFHGGEKEAVYADTYGDLNLSKVDNNSASGDYTVHNPVSGSKTNTYVRTLSSLSNFKAGEKTLYDEYGGIMNSDIKGKKTGFFHAEVIDGKNYIIDPIGNPFYSMAVNTVNSGSTTNQKEETIAKYGSEEKFYEKIVGELLGDFGINSIFGSKNMGYPILMQNGMVCVVSVGGISDYMRELGLSISTGGSSGYYYNNTMNVFDPDYIPSVDKSVAAAAALYKDQPYLLGYTLDNELPGGEDILNRYLTVPADEPVNAFSYATAWTWLKEATGKVNPSLDDVTIELSVEFMAFLYNRYAKVISEALDKNDPNHMYLGNRAHGPLKNNEGYLRGMGRYVDVFTINMYGVQNYAAINECIEKIYKFTGKAFIVSEFGMRAKESVDMNGYRLGNHADTACWLFDTQVQRAASYESYVLNLIESGNCVGWVIYRFQDNDQSLYQDAAGNIYSLSSGASALEPSYSNVKTGAVVKGIEVTQIHKGETDTSNLNHNKGIYDNHMEPYPEMMDSMKAISENLQGLLDHFEK